MYLGRPHLFQCNFCKKEFQKFGSGLPDGMKYIPANTLEGTEVQHICRNCEFHGFHGNKTLIPSGKRS